MADFNIREITPIDNVPLIDEIPALFVVGADDDFIPPHHSEQLIEAYTQGITKEAARFCQNFVSVLTNQPTWEAHNNSSDTQKRGLRLPLDGCDDRVTSPQPAESPPAYFPSDNESGSD